MKSLVQKTLFHTKEFRLEKSFINVREITPSKDESWSVSYDELELRKFYKKNKLQVVLCFYGIMIIMCIVLLIHELLYSPDSNLIGVMIVMILGWFFAASISWLTNKHWKLYLTGGKKNVEFFGNVPDEEKVNTFINEIAKIRKEYFFMKYLDDSFEEMDYYGKTNVLNWFRKSEIIDEKEYGDLKKKYQIEEQKQGVIGFNLLDAE